MTNRERIEALLIGVGAVTILFFILVALHEIFRYIYLLLK